MLRKTVMSKPEQIRFAAHARDYALALCIRTLPEGHEREALIACEDSGGP